MYYLLLQAFEYQQDHCYLEEPNGFQDPMGLEVQQDRTEAILLHIYIRVVSLPFTKTTHSSSKNVCNSAQSFDHFCQSSQAK